MHPPVFEVVNAGLGITFQDRGRPGWRRFGVPTSGAMDLHAASWANRLLDNPPGATVLELLVQGACLRALNDVWIAITGAHTDCSAEPWRATFLRTGNCISFSNNRAGVWTYLAVEGGFVAPRHFGSASTYVRGNLGRFLSPGDILLRHPDHSFQLPPGVAGRHVHSTEVRNYAEPPPIRLWPAPQWEDFSPQTREQFLESQWIVSSSSDRTGYRLEGPPLNTPLEELVSEPVQPGTIQIPPRGQPIITMPDGPTIGGYSKLAMVHPSDLAWVAQARPGQALRFLLSPAAKA